MPSSGPGHGLLVPFLLAFTLTELACLAMLAGGTRLAGRPWLRRLGARVRQRKLRALDRVWPLTRVADAVRRGDARSAAAILAALIALKSAVSLGFGIVMVFWLPIAALVTPSIVTVHDLSRDAIAREGARVARLQVTSHALAAALGFAVAVAGPLAGRTIGEAVRGDGWTFAIAALLSLGWAVAAGRAEAGTLVRFGIPSTAPAP